MYDLLYLNFVFCSDKQIDLCKIKKKHIHTQIYRLDKEVFDRNTEDENRIRMLEEQLRKLSSTAEQWEERYQKFRKSLDGS